MAKIIKMADLYERYSTKEVKDDKHYFSELDRILDELFELAVERNMSWRDIASAAGLSYQTVVNLGERWTRRPQYRTVVLIAKALNRQVQLTENKGRAKAALKIAG